MDKYRVSQIRKPNIGPRIAHLDFYTMANYIVIDPWLPEEESFAQVMCMALNEREELGEQIVVLRDVLGELQKTSALLYEEIRRLKDILDMK